MPQGPGAVCRNGGRRRTTGRRTALTWIKAGVARHVGETARSMQQVAPRTHPGSTDGSWTRRGEVWVMASRWSRMVGWLPRPHAAMAAGSLLLIGLVLGVGGLAGTAAFVSYTNTEETSASPGHETRRVPYAEFAAERALAQRQRREARRAVLPMRPLRWGPSCGPVCVPTSKRPGTSSARTNTPEELRGPSLWTAQSVWGEMKPRSLGARAPGGLHDAAAMADEQAPRAARSTRTRLKSGEDVFDCHKGIADTKPAPPEDAAAEEEDFSP